MMKTLAPKLAICMGVFFLVVLVDYSECYSQTAEIEDVVYLKNGSILRGTIIEQIIGESLKIETRDGNVFVYSMDEVERITKEPAKHSATSFRQVGKKNGGVALLLSFVLPGGGQFYNGENTKGAVMLGISLVGAFIILDAVEDENIISDDGENAGFGLILIGGASIWSMIDAPISAARINRENGLATTYRVSDKLHVDFALLDIESRGTPYVRAVFSF